MKVNLSFKDYLNTKSRLKAAGEDRPRSKKLYEATKYCKIPLLENTKDGEKQYINLKPKDRLEIIWEHESIESLNPKQIVLLFDDDQVMHFAWNDAKVKKWVESSITLI